MVSNDYFLFFLWFCWPTDTQICRYADRCSRLLTIDACLLVKIVFLLSRMSTKIDFCGATGHDHGGWQVAAAAETETTSTAEAAAVGRWRHRQWRRRKHRDNNDGDDRWRRLRRRPGITLLSAMATIRWRQSRRRQQQLLWRQPSERRWVFKFPSCT